LQREIEPQDFWHAPSGDVLAQVRASLAEQQLAAALCEAGLPIAIACAVPTGSMHPDVQYTFYWPDEAIRSAAAWLLVDVACDGRDHRDLRFRRRGWYMARIDLEEATGHWPVAAAHDLTRLVQQHQEAAS
jgi:hypothetical protein